MMNMNVILNLTSTFLGIACAIAAIAILFLLGVLLKNLPNGVRRLLSAILASMVIATFLRGLAAQFLYVLSSKAMLTAVFSIKIVSVTAMVGFLLYSANRFLWFVLNERRFLKGLSFCVNGFATFARDKKSSSSLFELKTSSVLLW